MREIIIDGNVIHSREDFYDAIRSQLTVPDYFGDNLDALHDIITEYSEQVRLIIENFIPLKETLGSSYLILLFTVMAESDGKVLINS